MDQVKTGLLSDYHSYLRWHAEYETLTYLKEDLDKRWERFVRADGDEHDEED